MLSASRFGPVSMASLSALVGGAVLLQLAGSALNIIIPIEMALDRHPPILIGVVASAYPAGFLIGCFNAARLTRRVGHIRSFAIFAALQATLALLLVLLPSPGSWLLIRAASGFAGAGLAIVVESWINDRTPPSYRGRVFGLYNVINRLALIIGQLWPSLTALPTATAFVVMGALYSMALVPVSLTRTRSPRTPEIVTLRVRELWRATPISVAGCLYVGLMGGALVSVLPAYGVLIGLSPQATGLLAAAVQVGALLLQWPLGFASDRMDRRRVTLFAGATSLLASAILLIFSSGNLELTWIIFAVIGSSSLPIYALSVAHAFDKIGREQAVALSSTLLFTWASGSALGPLIVAGAMQVLGPQGLHVYIMVLSAVLVGFAAWRLATRSPPERRARF